MNTCTVYRSSLAAKLEMSDSTRGGEKHLGVGVVARIRYRTKAEERRLNLRSAPTDARSLIKVLDAYCQGLRWTAGRILGRLGVGLTRGRGIVGKPGISHKGRGGLGGFTAGFQTYNPPRGRRGDHYTCA